MARGVMAVADTQEDAEKQVLAGARHIRVLRSRQIDLSGLPPLRTGSLARHWVVVVEHQDADEEAKLPQHDDPENHCERETRLLYLKLAVDPELLVDGVIEEFPCPVCNHAVRLELPPPRDGRQRTGAACPACRAPLRRAGGRGGWEIVPAKPKATKSCLFCDAKADSYEHAIPRWISKRLGIRDFLSADDAFVAGGIAPRKQPISFANHRARILCYGCNQHFKHLEDDVIPLLVPMARGRTLSLDHESQALLALWAHKTAVALLAATPELRDAVPAQHRHAIRHDARAGANTWVSFFAWRGRPVLVTGQADVLERADARAVRQGYLALLTFAQVGVCVIGFHGPPRPDEIVAGELPPLLQFWPPKTRFDHWPPPPADNRILPAVLGFVPLRRESRLPKSSAQVSSRSSAWS